MSQDLRTAPSTHEEPGATRRRPRMPPIAYPILGLIFGAILVASFAMVLLALSEHELEIAGVAMDGKRVAALVALLMSMNILVGAALVAYGGRVRHRPASFPLLAAAFVLVVAGGGAALTIGEGEGEPTGPQPQRVSVVAVDLAFDPSEFTVSAGRPVEILFDNQDANIQHNISIFDGEDASAPSLFQGDLITGPSSATYRWEPPPPGSYFFHCDVHPVEMTGTVTVQEGEGGAPGGEAPIAADISAAGNQFSANRIELTAGAEVSITLTNNDPVPHNVAIFRGTDATGEVVFRGDTFPGPDATMEYTFEAPAPGEYFFHCDVHPTEMTGVVVFR